jgi:hypothetical protein
MRKKPLSRKTIESLLAMLMDSICADAVKSGMSPVGPASVRHLEAHRQLELKIDALLDEAWLNTHKPKKRGKKAESQ